MKIKISALDTLFFRDGKPFSMGEETWANGLFPPPPNVFYGALRSLYFSIFQNEFSQIDIMDETQKLVINSVEMFIDGKYRFPCPMDIVKIKEEEDKYTFLKLSPNPYLNSNPLDFLLMPSNKNEIVESMEGSAYIRYRNFKKYLSEGTAFPINQLNPVFEKDLIIDEPKVGIGRNNATFTTDEGKLYRVGMKRLKTSNTSFDFIIDFEGLDFKGQFPKAGFLKFGAENKSVHFEIFDNDPFPPNQQEKFSSDKFKIVLSSPAAFKNGWFPDFLNTDYQGIFDEKPVKLITASVGKQKFIGGFDMKKRKPKPMFKTVPAGSTYYLQFQEGVHEVAVKKIKLPCLNGLDKEGFGCAFIGKI